MGNKIAVVLCFFIFVSLFVFGCSTKKPTEPGQQPTAAVTLTVALTVTPVSTSTPVASPNLSGSVTFPVDAIGKQFVVVADTDANTANGNTAVFYGDVESVTENFAFLLAGGTYYIYAFVDMNGSGLTGPGGLDYLGSWNNWAGASTGTSGLNFNCGERIPAVITVNLTLPAAAADRSYFIALLNGNTIDVLRNEPAGGKVGIAPAGTQFSISFPVESDDPGPYYLAAFLDANGNGGGEGSFPDEGDYVKIYGGTGQNWPASKNFTITGDHTVNMTFVTASSNVSGTATLPSAANNKMYTVFVSNMPLNQGDAQGTVILTKTAQAGAGSTLNYSIFVPFPGNYYITLMVDMDDSGWNNQGSGPASTGDFGGIYGVVPPIINWQNPFPILPNAALPGTGFNITCVTVPDFSAPYVPPAPQPTPDGSVVGWGTVSGTVTIPDGHTDKYLMLMIDVDLNPNNGNTVGEYSMSIGDEKSPAYMVENVPAGTYYIYTVVLTQGGPPLSGDALGVYGATYPAFPGSANAVVLAGETLTANITAVTAAANFSGRVHMPASVPAGRKWAVIVGYNASVENPDAFVVASGDINTTNNYFDYSLLLPLPGQYFVYSIIDSAMPDDLFTNGISCGDYFGFYNIPMPVYFTPGANNTNINITTSGSTNCP